jgi:Xaa-Pro aminopeptidase
VYWLDQFETIMKKLMSEAQNVYLNTNEHLRANTEMETREDRFIKNFKPLYPAHTYLRSAPIMHEIRSVKKPIELDLMQHACDITEKGIRRIMGFIKPGVWEHEIEAELWHEFIRNRANGFAYTPIIASGYNACVLHYIENNQQCMAGDVILMDVGAEYANYSSDLTRCYPVSGKFTKRQKDVYNAVLHVKNEATKLLSPGVLLNEYHVEVGKIMIRNGRHTRSILCMAPPTILVWIRMMWDHGQSQLKKTWCSLWSLESIFRRRIWVSAWKMILW